MTRDEVAGRLPRPVSSFVGRASELVELARILPAARLVTLTGPSGIGKTRLAVEAATRLAPGYLGGAWMVDLTAVADPAFVPLAVEAALRLPPDPGRDPTETLIAHLRRQPTLLVFDNCEQVLEACAELCERLLAEAPEVTVLATTQQALRVSGEKVVAVSPMSLPESAGAPFGTAMRSEAVALFCARAASSSPSGFELTDEVAAAVTHICVRLDGIPLAIELAASRAGVLTTAEIAERLEDRFSLLTRGAGGAPARHQTLRASLDWSYDLLPPAQAALLRRLSVFRGGATMRTVEEVCSGGEVSRSEIPDLVSELVSRSLVSADASGPRARYHLLDTVRDYGCERLADEGELETQRSRHATWCLTVAERAAHQLLENNQFWLDAMQAELDNVRAALERAAVGREPRLGLRLAVAITPFWKISGQFREGQAWLKRTLEANPEAPTSLRARALWGIGMLAVLQGDVASATPAVEESLALARAGGLKRAEAQGLNLLGFISIFTQDPLAAMSRLEESVALARSVGDLGLLVNALALYGRAHLFLGDVSAARQVFEECLEVTGHDEVQTVDSFIGLGWAAFIAGEHRRAGELFGRALPLARALGERYDIALVLSFLGELAWARGDGAEARARLEEGLSLARAMGAPFPMVRCLGGLALVALSDADLATARTLADDACALARRSRLPYAYVRCLHIQGVVRVASGDAHGAQVALDEALATARDNFDDAGAAVSSYQLARLARSRGNDQRAASLASEALAIQVLIPDAAGTASGLELLAGLALTTGRQAHAARLLGAAESIRDEAKSPRPPDEAAGYQADLARLVAEAEPTDRERDRAAGGRLSPSDAVALATRGRGPQDRPPHGSASLTPAERQVVDLAAAGLTNNEIGEKLFISARTVQGRLLRIFPKLGVKSRRELRELRELGGPR
ncbi:MAG: LuxR C-terminal-related transcriptional regulator [Acidimicrobiales bacterium]